MSPRAGLRCRPWRDPASGPGGRTARVGGGPRGLRTRRCAAPRGGAVHERPSSQTTAVQDAGVVEARHDRHQRVERDGVGGFTAQAAGPQHRQPVADDVREAVLCLADALRPRRTAAERARRATRPPLTIRAGSAERASCAAKATASGMFSATATPADRSPSAHNAPRCVLTPPVVREHAALACAPDVRRCAHAGRGRAASIGRLPRTPATDLAAPRRRSPAGPGSCRGGCACRMRRPARVSA